MSPKEFRVFLMTLDNKNENTDQGKCLSLLVTNYDPGLSFKYILINALTDSASMRSLQ